MARKVSSSVETPKLFKRALPTLRLSAQTIHTWRVKGDLASGLIMGISRVTIWVIGVINLLIKFP